MRKLLAAMVAALPILAGCGNDLFGNRDAHKPGTAIGTFHVVGRQTSNSCGAGALGATSPWEFDVDLARDGSALYWNNGASIIVGEIDDDGVSFSVQGSVLMDMRNEEHPGLPCSVSRQDTARGALASASADVAGFTATLTYDFAATAGSRCDDLVVSDISVAPVFAALPCGMAYDLKATKTEAHGD